MSCIVHRNGGISTFGRGGPRLGHGPGGDDMNPPRKMEEVTDVVGVACGDNHTLIRHTVAERTALEGDIIRKC